jgi:hypothetical protein
VTAQISSVIISQAVADETCLAYAQGEMSRLLEIATACGAPHELIESIKEPGLSDASDQRAECQQRGETLTEQDCPLVPVCASLALEYAIENIDRFNGDCTSATEAGVKYVFVPE